MTCATFAIKQGDIPPSAGSLRVLIVSHLFWPEEFRINELARDLRDRGHHVMVVTGYPNYPGHRVFPRFRREPEKFSTYDGDIAVERFPTIGIGSSPIGLIINYLSLAITMTLLAPWRLRGRRFDAIICFQPSPFTIVLPALILGWLKRAPVILWVLDCWPETLEAVGIVRNKVLIKTLGAIVGYAYRRCAIVLGQSQSFGRSIARWSRRSNLFGHFPNWVEDLYVDHSAITSIIRDVPARFTVVFAGNIGEAQDFPTVIDAIDTLRDQPIRWIIVGSGRMEGWLRSEIACRCLSNQVEMLGRRPTEEMPALFAEADALLVSLADKPVFAMTVPGKVQSYMAAGKPIIGVLDGEGATLIAEARCGLTAPAGDSRALAEIVAQLAKTSSDIRAHMGENGRAFAAAHFDRRNVLDKFEKWLAELAGNNWQH